MVVLVVMTMARAIVVMMVVLVKKDVGVGGGNCGGDVGGGAGCDRGDCSGGGGGGGEGGGGGSGGVHEVKREVDKQDGADVGQVKREVDTQDGGDVGQAKREVKREGDEGGPDSDREEATSDPYMLKEEAARVSGASEGVADCDRGERSWQWEEKSPIAITNCQCPSVIALWEKYEEWRQAGWRSYLGQESPSETVMLKAHL